MREPDRSDLSALDPQRDAQHWERMVRQIMARSAVELHRRQQAVRFGLFDGLLAWARPALATAAALALLSLLSLTRGQTPAMSTFIRSPAMPVEVSVWLEEGQPPSMLDLIVLRNGEN